MKAITLFFILLLVKTVSFAAGGGGEHGEDHVPYKTIMFQAINLGILLIGIFFAIRKSVTMAFAARLSNYNEQAEKTALAAKQAEEALADIKGKIQKIQETEQAAIETAKKDAEALKNKIVNEALAQAEKLKADTKLIIAAEVNSAKDEIRKEIINASIEIARNNIKNSSEAITKKSEKGFLSDLANTKNQVNL